MKNLYLVRHAKSSWADASRTDFNRSLNTRGKSDAPVMGAYLKDKRKVEIDQVLCSTAKRARATAKRLLRPLNYSLDDVQWEELIYHGDMHDILEFILKVDDGCENLMVIGHNPDMTDLANMLGDRVIENVPTCGVVCISFETDRWRDIGEGKTIFFDVPKEI